MPRRTIATVERRKLSSQKYRLNRAYNWVDPFPEVHGTLPEKMVYAELTRLGVPFLFLNELRYAIPELDFDKYYQSDFIIPSIKLIIEVQGAFWHTKTTTIEQDAFKFSIYELLGYRVLAWWDYDIISRLHELVFAEPALLQFNQYQPPGRSTELPVERRTKSDTSKGIRTLNTRRKTYKNPRITLRKLRKAKYSYGKSR